MGLLTQWHCKFVFCSMYFPLFLTWDLTWYCRFCFFHRWKRKAISVHLKTHHCHYLLLLLKEPKKLDRQRVGFSGRMCIQLTWHMQWAESQHQRGGMCNWRWGLQLSSKDRVTHPRPQTTVTNKPNNIPNYCRERTSCYNILQIHTTAIMFRSLAAMWQKPIWSKNYCHNILGCSETRGNNCNQCCIMRARTSGGKWTVV